MRALASANSPHHQNLHCPIDEPLSALTRLHLPDSMLLVNIGWQDLDFAKLEDTTGLIAERTHMYLLPAHTTKTSYKDS